MFSNQEVNVFSMVSLPMKDLLFINVYFILVFFQPLALLTPVHPSLNHPTMTLPPLLYLEMNPFDSSLFLSTQ